MSEKSNRDDVTNLPVVSDVSQDRKQEVSTRKNTQLAGAATTPVPTLTEVETKPVTREETKLAVAKEKERKAVKLAKKVALSPFYYAGWAFHNHVSRHYGVEYKKYANSHIRIAQADLNYFEAVAEISKQTRWMDEQRAPFGKVMNELGINNRELNKRLSSLLWCHGISALFVIYYLYLVVSSLLGLILYDFPFANFIYAMSLLLITIFIWMHYSYHVWVFRTDKFGTFRHWLHDLFDLSLTTIFPYTYHSQTPRAIDISEDLF